MPYKVGTTIAVEDFDQYEAKFQVPDTFTVEASTDRGRHSTLHLSGSDGAQYVAERNTSDGVDSWSLALASDWADEIPIGVALTREYGKNRYAITYFAKVAK